MPPPSGEFCVSARILFVDDAEEVRNAVACMLRRKYDVVTASSAAEAIEIFDRTGPFPVVLSDYSMPDTDGFELLRAVHAHAPDTAGILLTGVPEFDMATRAVNEAGVYRFLAKPCDFETLARVIDDSLARHEQLVREGTETERLIFSKES